MKDLISIIVRTKNEERWIAQCLQSVFSQDYSNFEVIVVDNESTDKTLDKIKQYPVSKVITCQDYRPGRALNRGIRESRGKYLACLSGHCIPVNHQWLTSLHKNFEAEDVAGVYGRQEPMSFTPDSDKRDLAIIFGLDRKIQKKDSFFHNANSMLRRDLWEKTPFDENTTNIEDRIWAQEILKQNYNIIYAPEASVCHYHGIHQNGDMERCTNVVKILEKLKEETYPSILAEKLNIVALIPVKGRPPYIHGESLLFHTIQRALESKYIKRILVATDDIECAEIAKKLGAEVPFIRDRSLSQEQVDIVKVLQYSLHRIEELNILPDLVVSMEITFPFRPPGLLDHMITQLTQQGLDSVIAVKKENKGMWKEKNGTIIQIDEGITPRQFKDPAFIELRGIGCVTYPEFIRQGKLMGNNIGMSEINNPYSHLEVRTSEDTKMAAPLFKEFFSWMRDQK